MTKTLTIITALLLGTAMTATTALAKEYQFGDHKSSTLTGKAWQAFNAENYEDAIVYAKKCVELYQEPAAEMQAGLDEFVEGTNEEIFAYWALNDVATSLFIQAKSLLALEKTDEAQAVIRTLVDDFTFGQCWDPSGWFWKPSKAAKELL
ncbi:MAG: beta-glucanase precursor [Candidatus Omnitrophica bacterium]|nr:beta-glucanase precursor [Candidatus Omnitrophota bacterium]